MVSSPVKRLRVAVLADLLEERWPSMDLVAEMLVRHVREPDVELVLVRPPLRRRFTRLAITRNIPGAFTVDRFSNRLWDYPRSLSRLVADFDVFHVVDHSYSQLVHRLPAARTVVTCHDIDTFRSLVAPKDEPRSAPYRAMARHILEGLRKAATVVCDSEATRRELGGNGLVSESRLSVIPNGVDSICSPAPSAEADRAVETLIGPAGRTIDLVHVGSTIERKRIDVLLRILAHVREALADVRLLRVGGAFTAGQRDLADALGVTRSVVVLPHVSRAVLAALYRRAALTLLVSEREGFGLPLLESMACGTPVVASDIAVLREVGGAATTYCRAGDVEAWSKAVASLLDERRSDAAAWQARRQGGIAWASRFTWAEYGRRYADIYRAMARQG